MFEDLKWDQTNFSISSGFFDSHGDSGSDESVNHHLIEKLAPFVSMLAGYHRHETFGMENIPAKGRGLIVMNHSLATYDMALLLNDIRLKKMRLPRPLIDRLFFKVPFAGDLMNSLGAVQGTKNQGKSLLERENLVAVAPGGMREALRPSKEKYKINWEDRTGFVSLALQTKSPVILAICPRADDLYKLYDNPITPLIYKHFRVPVFLARGLGFSPIPRPVQLTHFLSEPIEPQTAAKTPKAFARQVTNLHKKLVKMADELIEIGLNFDVNLVKGSISPND